MKKPIFQRRKGSVSVGVWKNISPKTNKPYLTIKITKSHVGIPQAPRPAPFSSKGWINDSILIDSKEAIDLLWMLQELQDFLNSTTGY